MTDDQLQTVRTIMREVRVAMLTTVAADGSLTSRPMATQQAEFDGDAWFVLQRDSDVAREVGAEPRVNVAYSGSSSWLSAAGRAEVVVDHAKKVELWNDAVEAWFPGGQDDPDIVLLKVHGESAQYWDSPGRVATMLDMVKARLTGSQAGDSADGGTVQL